MKLTELKEKYSSIKEKYHLPDFEVLDKEFEIRDITNENIILREIRDRILEKFDDYIKILEGIVMPETNLVHMYESKVFDEKQKNEVFKTYKQLMFLERFSLQAGLEDGDEKIAEFINVSYKGWLDNKEKILEIIIGLKESWKKDDEMEFHVPYMG